MVEKLMNWSDQEIRESYYRRHTMGLIETSGTLRVVAAIRVVQRVEGQLIPWQPVDFEGLGVLFDAMGIIPDTPLSVN